MTLTSRAILAICLVLALACTLAAPPTAFAQARTPLLMEGKKTLYQRVLTRPGAQLMKNPGDATGKPVWAFSQYYVYDRKPAADGKQWIEVGAGSRGRIDGWLDAETVLPWKQQMSLIFTNPAGRDRTLLFDKREDVVSLVKAPDSAAAVAPIRKAVEAGSPSDPKVVSIEPATYVDIQKEFYLLPILEAKAEDSGKGFTVRVLEVASVTAKPGSTGPGASPAAVSTAIKGFSAAVVFVIDSTTSMKPYIDRTRQAVKQIYQTIEAAGLSRQVRFGLVAFRSSTKAVPKLEYTAKVFADPNDVKDATDFLARVADLTPATVSSAKFDEDAYAGVMEAVNQINWDRFGGKYVVLITDAGAIDGGDALSATGFNAEQVRLELERKGIALYALHLKTPEGKRNHGRAEQQYKELSKNAHAGEPLYYDIGLGSVETFGSNVEAFAGDLVAQVRAAAKGEMVPGSARTATGAPKSAATRMAEATALVGRAMQLAYLGRVLGTPAPPFFHAWLSDRDFAQPDRATTEVRVLLTKNQLADLAQVVTAVLEAGEKSQATSTADFFDLIRSAAAHLARDPAALKDPKATRLGQLGLLGEYLDDLPYQSAVLSLDRDDWIAWSPSQQEELLDKLRRNLRLYRVYTEDVGRWVALAPDAEDGDKVYPVPLEALP